MADFSFDFEEDFLKNLLQSEFDEIAEECLKEAAPSLEKSMKEKVKASIRHSGDSELVNSIKSRKPHQGKDGDWLVFVGPSGNSKTTYTKGKRTYPVSNALKAVWLEYGIQHEHHHQAARPFISASVNASKADVMKKMQEAYMRKVAK